MYNIAHIAIIAKDIEVSKEFYCKVLGCKVKNRHENDRLKFLYLSIDGQTIELLQYNDEYAERGRGVIDHIAFYVEDIEHEINRLKDINIDFLFDRPREVNGSKIIFFFGPNGERIEFIENKYIL